MTLYTTDNQSAAYWPDPLEQTWHLLGGEPATSLAPKLPHLGLTDVLFLSTVMNIPRPQRPWGIVTWLAEVFNLSRPALYALAERVAERLLAEPEAEASQRVAPAHAMIEPEADVTANRLARTVLTAAFPGKMAIRPIQQVLDEAFAQRRSVGWLSELLMEAGLRAGDWLRQVDTTPLGPVIVARDETFFQGQPLLLVIDPVSTTILLAEACADRQADTWGAALLVAQEQGAEIAGLVEDMARPYPKSQREAEMDVSVQKDVWHVQRDGSNVRRALERAAFAATRQVLKLEEHLLEEWDEDCFDQEYVPAVTAEEQAYAQHAAFVDWLGHLCDALEIVDLRSGEIRDHASNEWLLEATLTGMETIDHSRVRTFVGTLRRHQKELLTYLEWLAAALAPYRETLAQSIADPTQRQSFMRLVARCWRLRQAVISGHRWYQRPLQEAEAELQAILDDTPQWQPLAQRLQTLLDAATRTSSLIESINGLLKQFLANRRSFRNAQTLQLYLNLFTLWHNMRVYERGKRAGYSPYQLAGITLETDDWLELLGYPAE
jgi:hypothetical protein